MENVINRDDEGGRGGATGAGSGLESSFEYGPENPMKLQERGASVEGRTGYGFLTLDWVWRTAVSLPGAKCTTANVVRTGAP